MGEHGRAVTRQMFREPNGTVPHLEVPPCSILELDDSRCRWPLGEVHEVAVWFCGDSAAPGHCYCAHPPAAGIEKRIGELINAQRAAVGSRRSIASAAYFGACGFPL